MASLASIAHRMPLRGVPSRAWRRAFGVGIVGAVGAAALSTGIGFLMTPLGPSTPVPTLIWGVMLQMAGSFVPALLPAGFGLRPSAEPRMRAVARMALFGLLGAFASLGGGAVAEGLYIVSSQVTAARLGSWAIVGAAVGVAVGVADRRVRLRVFVGNSVLLAVVGGAVFGAIVDSLPVPFGGIVGAGAVGAVVAFGISLLPWVMATGWIAGELDLPESLPAPACAHPTVIGSRWREADLVLRDTGAPRISIAIDGTSVVVREVATGSEVRYPIGSRIALGTGAIRVDAPGAKNVSPAPGPPAAWSIAMGQLAVIGSHVSCLVQVGSPGVSERHATVLGERGRFIVAPEPGCRVLVSFLGGLGDFRESAARTALRDGSLIQVGSATLRVEVRQEQLFLSRM